jgi:hypothetical protein
MVRPAKTDWSGGAAGQQQQAGGIFGDARER